MNKTYLRLNPIKYVKKNSVTLILLAIIFIAGASILIIAAKQINSQKEQLTLLQKTIKKDQLLATQEQKQILFYKEQLSSASAQIKTLLNKPPQVEYKYNTQYVGVPVQTGYYAAPVTYTQQGSVLHGSNGSTCIRAGSELNCTGGY